MTEQELTETIDTFKKEHMENIKKLMYQKGELLPMICVLVHDTIQDKPMVVVAPIMGDFSETGKDAVVNKVIPQIFTRLKEEEKIPLCFSFSSEAWLRQVQKDELPKDWKSLEKTESIITTFETREGSEVICNIMHRQGQSINDEGELVNRIELEPMDVGSSKGSPLSGRFGDLFKRYGF